jgi:uncharacterized protein YjbI with pentapeptide repeats
MDLQEQTLAGPVMKHPGLRDANLAKSSFFRTDLQFANLGGAVLTDATLTEADARSATFVGSTVEQTRFTRADLRAAEFSHTARS